MTEEVKVQDFDFNGSNVRALIIDGEPYFVGKDVASNLGYKKPRNAITNHVEDEDKTSALIQGTGSNYKSKSVVINESGLYSLILSSKLPTAKEFKHWVTSEVLPKIRQQGFYLSPSNIDDPLLMAQTAEQLSKYAYRVLEQNKKIAEDKPKVDYHDKVLDSKGSYSATDIAKELGLTAKQFNSILNKEHIQFKKGPHWYLYEEYQDKGLTDTKTSNAHGFNFVSMRWTEKGREFLHEYFKENNL